MALGLDAVLGELLGRLDALHGQAADVPAADMRRWQPEVVAALQAAGVLVPGPPVESMVCDGCEEACIRPVHIRAWPGGESGAFVLCVQRDDIDQVAIALEDLKRWRLTAQTLADAVAGLMGGGTATATATATATSDSPKRYRLGFVQGKKQGRALVYLRFEDEGPRLVLAGHALALQDTLLLHNGQLALDQRQLMRCVDAPADGATAEPPEEQAVVGKRMLARKLELKGAGRKAFLNIIAQEEGCSASWVKQLIAKASAPNPFAGLGAPVAHQSTVSTRNRRPR